MNYNPTSTYFRVKLAASGQQGAQSLQVEFIREGLHNITLVLPLPHGLHKATYLDDDLHQILLSNTITALNDLLQNARQDVAFVGLDIDFDLTQSLQVFADKRGQIFAFLFSLLFFATNDLMLHADPQLVHFDEVGQNKVDGIANIATPTIGREMSMLEIAMKYE